jgi:hypothetical protein
MKQDNSVTATLDPRIAELVYCIREDNQLIASAEKRIKEAKAELQLLLEVRGANWSDEAGYARLISEGHRFHYDTETLDKLLITDPLRYGWLKDFRRETVIPERVQVK